MAFSSLLSESWANHSHWDSCNALRMWVPFLALVQGCTPHHFSLWDTKKTGAGFQGFAIYSWFAFMLSFGECLAETTWAQTLIWGHKWFFTLALSHPTHQEKKTLKRTMGSLNDKQDVRLHPWLTLRSLNVVSTIGTASYPVKREVSKDFLKNWAHWPLNVSNRLTLTLLFPEVHDTSFVQSSSETAGHCGRHEGEEGV